MASLYRLPLWLSAAAAIVALLLAVEGGFRAGRCRSAGFTDAGRAQLATLQAAVLSLLALLLGFSFSMAETRYETRRQLVVAESNALGTAALRAQLIDEPQRSEVTRLLRRYVDVRIAFHRVDADATRMRLAGNETRELQGALWSRAAAARPRDDVTSLFVQSLNDVIDLHARRIAAFENRVPRAILTLIVCVAVVAFAFVGYGSGLTGGRHFIITLLAIVVFVSVIVLILDFDRPRSGMVRVSQDSMLRLRRSLQGD
jgi:hypothetical protein